MLIPAGMPVPCGGEVAPGFLLFVDSFTGCCSSAVPLYRVDFSRWLSFLVTDGIFDLGIDDLLNDGILLSCLTRSCPFVVAVGSLFSLAESGLFVDSPEEVGIFPVGLSFWEALSLRLDVGIKDFLPGSCPLSPLLIDGILLLGGVRSSVTGCFVTEEIVETGESVFSACFGARASDGILDISQLLPAREQLSSMELFEGDLHSELEVKLLLPDDLLTFPSVFTSLKIGELLPDRPLVRVKSLFSR